MTTVSLVRLYPLALASLVLPLLPSVVAAPAHAATSSRHTLTTITSDTDWRGGGSSGVSITDGSLRLAKATSTATRSGVTYDAATWTSPWIVPGHGFTEVIPSWQASTPGGTWIVVRLRPQSANGTVGAWKELGRWSADNAAATARTSSGSQVDAVSSVSTDTLVARPRVTMTRYQIKVWLLRKRGSTATPVIRSLHAVASAIGGVPTPTTRALPAKSLVLPTYSQMIHRGEYPQYGGGGEAWCSPTSLAMVLGYYGALPPASAYSWVTRGSDRWVDEVARRVYDIGYEGTGNWPFNTAYAAARGLDARVTRLPDLRAAEAWIAKGVPLEVSIAFFSGQLSGAPISSTPGHLVVIRGFTSAGNVIVNDPAAPTDASVSRVYDRAQFEAAWQRKSHGLTYLVTRSQ